MQFFLSLTCSGFPPGIFEWGGGGSKRGGEFGGPSPGEKNSQFEILMLKMADFNQNDSKIWNIECQQGGSSPPVVLSGGNPVAVNHICLKKLGSVLVLQIEIVFGWPRTSVSV